MQFRGGRCPATPSTFSAKNFNRTRDLEENFGKVNKTFANIISVLTSQQGKKIELKSIKNTWVFIIWLLLGVVLCAIFGGTHAITIGPTALMALVTYDSGAYQMGSEAAIVLSFITRCVIFILGLLNFGHKLLKQFDIIIRSLSINYILLSYVGFLIDFVAAPVVAGFTTAATFTIATIQVNPLLGLEIDEEGFLILGLSCSNISKREKSGTLCSVLSQ